MNLEACLPAELREPVPTITKITAGLSGAGVYRVEAAGHTYVLKISDRAEPVDAWRRKLEIQRQAAAAGVAPAVVHGDEATRSILSEHVADRSFARAFMDPRTRADALALLGRALRRTHALPLPAGAVVRDERALIRNTWSQLATFAVPAFVGDAVRRVLDPVPPPPDRPAVLSHNDVNPTNLVYDGERVFLLDWDAAGANDPLFDLATVAVFLRMDEATCLQLIALHDGHPADRLPDRFAGLRVLVAVMCGTVFLQLARHAGHAGDAAFTLDSTRSLAELYTQMRTGAVSVATSEGRWQFGLALIKDSFSLA